MLKAFFKLRQFIGFHAILSFSALLLYTPHKMQEKAIKKNTFLKIINHDHTWTYNIKSIITVDVVPRTLFEILHL